MVLTISSFAKSLGEAPADKSITAWASKSSLGEIVTLLASVNLNLFMSSLYSLAPAAVPLVSSSPTSGRKCFCTM